MVPWRVVATMGCLLWAPSALAQSDFSNLKIKPGDIVYVTDATGVEVSGPVTSLAPSLLSIGSHSFAPMPGLKIERRGDPIWDGAVYGALAGLAVGALAASGECGVGGSATVCVLSGGAWFAGIGAFIDYRHKGRTRVFVGSPTPSTRSVRGSPGRSASLLVQIRF
jgi:hypothetical protein